MAVACCRSLAQQVRSQFTRTFSCCPRAGGRSIGYEQLANRIALNRTSAHRQSREMTTEQKVSFYVQSQLLEYVFFIFYYVILWYQHITLCYAFVYCNTLNQSIHILLTCHTSISRQNNSQCLLPAVNCCVFAPNLTAKP